MKKIKTRKFEVSEEMIIYAFRYCLGRKTYSVGICVDKLIELWNELSDGTKNLICKEIEEAFDRNYISFIDAPNWNSILVLANKEPKTVKKEQYDTR